MSVSRTTAFLFVRDLALRSHEDKSDNSVYKEYDYENLIPTLFTNTVSDGSF